MNIINRASPLCSKWCAPESKYDRPYPWPVPLPCFSILTPPCDYNPAQARRALSGLMGVCCSAGYCSELWGCDCYHCCDDCCGCRYYCFDEERYHRGYGPGHPNYGPHLGAVPPPVYGYPRSRGFPRLWGSCEYRHPMSPFERFMRPD